MTVGAYQFRMKAHDRKSIRAGADIFTDGLWQDLASLARGGRFEDTYMAGWLPARFKKHYDLEFAKRYMDVGLAVAWKLADKRQWKLNSVAEEIALWAVLLCAQESAEMQAFDFDPRDLADDLFEDTDFLMLYEGRYDGIEHDRDISKELGIENLNLQDWFKPFKGKGGYEPA